jgi:putative endonuclease
VGETAHLGKAGEREASRFLRRLRYRILAKGFRCALGEIDVVALDGETIVFVEVKARRDDEAADIEEAVNRTKRRRLTRAAKYFLQQKRADDRPARFDIVAIRFGDVGRPEIRHTIDAFGPT